MNNNVDELEQQFNDLYNDAVVKTAIGVHIIKKVGTNNGMDEALQSDNIHTMCNTLADGVQVPRATVYNDVLRVYTSFPPEFFEHPEVLKLILELTKTMTDRNLLGS